MRKRGRPFKNEDEKVNQKITILLTKNEKDRLKQLADKNELSLSNCVRELLNMFFKIQDKKDI